MEHGELAESPGEQVMERDTRLVAVAMHRLTHVGDAAIEFGIVRRKFGRFPQETIAHEVALRLVRMRDEGTVLPTKCNARVLDDPMDRRVVSVSNAFLHICYPFV
jgi:hypothetical protein